ncbi:MAG: EF-P lysine aminoacylase EpmA [Gammaproteobacteria bacterium]
MTAAWQPAASVANLTARARMLATVRDFFARRRIMEVDTPALGQAPVTDPQIASIALQLTAIPDAALYLHSSPEIQMKRLLAAGAPDIYQLGKVYRDGERGRHHQPEFTLIEWYRRDLELSDMVAETLALIQAIAAVAGASPPQGDSLSYAQAFERHVGINPLEADPAAIRACALEKTPIDSASLGNDTIQCLDLLMSHCVAPALAPNTLTTITHYPAAQAALARLDPADARVAERFEVFWRGVELANGYRELTDPQEQRRRFDADQARRASVGLPPAPADESLLAALEAGLPECCGVAVGFDRVLMLSLDLPHIDQAISFPV